MLHCTVKFCDYYDFEFSQLKNKGIPVIRPSNKKRERGHLKKLYCCTCKKETNHAEVSGYAYTYEDFMTPDEVYQYFTNGTGLIDKIPEKASGICRIAAFIRLGRQGKKEPI